MVVRIVLRLEGTEVELVWDFLDKDCLGNCSWRAWPGEWWGRGQCRWWRDSDHTCPLVAPSHFFTCFRGVAGLPCPSQGRGQLSEAGMLSRCCTRAQKEVSGAKSGSQNMRSFPRKQKAVLCLSNQSSAELGMGCATMIGIGKWVKNRHEWNILRPGCAGGNR